jgi:copper chaperone CopZ
VDRAASPDQDGTGNGAAEPDRSSTAELAVEGMHCSSCVALIEESLVDEDGVLGASVDLDSGRARVTFDPARLGVDRIRSVILEAGYPATPIG